MGGLKRLYGENFGHSGNPGKVFEVTCRKDGTLDEEGLGSIYYGVRHLGITRMEICGPDFGTHKKTIEQIRAANIEGFGKVDVRKATIGGSKSFDFKNADVGVLCCSDSRVQPYQIFEGSNIVVVSNAGNVLSPVAVEAFGDLVEAGVPVLAVLGHSKCGAVGAAMGENDESMIAEILRKIRANINIGNGQSRLGKEVLNALVGYSILGGESGIYGNSEASVRLQKLIKEKEVERMAFFMDLSSGSVRDIRCNF
jgi:carbonic anhydrase